MSKAKAREYFKNCASEIFRNLKNKFEEQQFHHIMPENFFQHTIDGYKAGIVNSLNRLTDKIVKVTTISFS